MTNFPFNSSQRIRWNDPARLLETYVHRLARISATAAAIMIVSLLTPLSSSPALAADVTTWSMQGVGGDTIIGNSSYNFDVNDGATIVASGDASAVDVTVTKDTHSFSAELSAPTGDTLDPGDVFLNATRFPGTTGGLDVTGDGSGCNEVRGDFVVHDITFDAGTGDLTSLSVTFEHHCEGAQASLLGSIAFHVAAAESVPTQAAIALRGALDTNISAPTDLAVNAARTTGSQHDINSNWVASSDPEVVGYVAVLSLGAQPAASPLDNDRFFVSPEHHTSTHVPNDDTRTVSVFAYDGSGNWSNPVSRTIRGATLTEKLSDSKVKYGADVKIQGQLRTSAGAPLTSQKVTLYRKDNDTSVWTQVSSDQTAAKGAYGFKVTAKENASFRVDFAGGLATYGTSAPSKALQVSKVVSAQVKDNRVRVGKQIEFKGRVSPNEPALTKLQIYWRGKWRTVAQGNAGLDGRFTAVVTMTAANTYKFRFLCPKTPDSGAGTSRALRVTVT
ncbi:MAG TPA: hypothetical protein VMT88_00765 [Actinomycetes bacterium]|nr:hypothetical protein [Actinomycetes bacterium]